MMVIALLKLDVQPNLTAHIYVHACVMEIQLLYQFEVVYLFTIHINHSGPYCMDNQALNNRSFVFKVLLHVTGIGPMIQTTIMLIIRVTVYISLIWI